MLTVVPLGDLTDAVLPVLAELEMRVHRASAHYDAQPWGVENFARPLPGKPELSLVASVDAVAVGFLVASRRAGGVHVHRLAVDPDHRRRGIAAVLLSRVVAGCAGVVTVICDPRNASALQFYARAGFAVEGTTDDGKVLLAACGAAAHGRTARCVLAGPGGGQEV